MVTDHFSGCRKSGVWGDKLTGLCDRAQRAYERNTRPCSFFDPNVEHGGPEPEGGYIIITIIKKYLRC